jgi:hypothetical protein
MSSRSAPPIPVRPAASAAGVKAKGSGRRSKRSKRDKGQESQGVAAAYSHKMVSKQPYITGTRNSKRVRHCEMVVPSVDGSTTFKVQNVLQLNPGLQTFPWLATESKNWTQYTVHKLEAKWVPIAPTSTQGDVIICPNYNAQRPAPTTEQQAANNKDAVTESVWKSFVVPLDPIGMMGLAPRRFIRTSQVSGDIKTYDVGKLFICTNNETGIAAVGKVFLEYDIEFFEPENEPDDSFYPQNTSMFTLESSQSFTSTFPQYIFYDTIGPGAPQYDPLGWGLPLLGIWTPPAGAYRITAGSSFQDSTVAADTFRSQLIFFRNGVAINNNYQQSYQSSQIFTASSMINSLTLDCVVTLDGTDTFGVVAILNGAGTMSALSSYSQICISLA